MPGELAEDPIDVENNNHTDQNTSTSLWKVSTLPNIGKVLLATRDIKPWEKVLEDTALVTAPCNSAACLGCLGAVSGEVVCARCKWPVCQKQCQDQQSHQEECWLFQSSQIFPKADQLESSHGIYSFISVLRILLLKTTDKARWQIVEEMMDHWGDRSKDKRVVEGIITMTKLFHEKLGLTWVSREDVQHAYGVLKTNSVGFMSGLGQALYPVVSIMSHSCVANLESVKDPEATISFRAKRLIKKGEELSMRYTDFLDSKKNIQRKIKNEWVFTCSCVRCSDPSDFGSNFSSFQCGCGGFYYQEKADSLNKNWKCSVCLKNVNLADKYARAENLQQMLENEDVDKMLHIIENEGYHKNFYVTTNCYMKYLEKHKSSHHCQTLNSVVDKAKVVLSTLARLDGGCTRLNGKYLMMLMMGQHKLIMIRNKEQKMDEIDLKSAMMEITKGRLQAAKMMSPFMINGK